MDQDESLLEIDEIQFSDKYSLNQGQKSIIEDVISWRIQPPLVKTGRSTYLIIQEEKLPFKGIKIKGCGFFDPFSQAVMQPLSQDGYESHIQNQPDGIKEIHYQIEVDDNDELIYTIPKKRPFGGQNYDQALVEYSACNKLLDSYGEKNFPFYFPIGYAKYTDLNYKSKPLGVSVLGIGSETEITLGTYFAGQFEEKGIRINPQILKYWQNHVSPLAQNQPDYFEIIKTLRKLSFEFGKTLSMLHKYYVDHDSHLFNASVNNEEGFVMIFDLDHVLDVDDISAQKYFYYALKDFEIGLVAILSNFMLSGFASGLAMFEEVSKPIHEYNVIEGFFEGYFGELCKEAKNHTKEMWERVVTICINQLPKVKQEDLIHVVYNFCEKEREESFIDVFNYFKDKIKNNKPALDLNIEKHAQIIKKFLDQKLKLSKEHNVTS